jgi:hypothetical protein
MQNSPYSQMWRRIGWYKFRDISEERAASIFSVQI